MENNNQELELLTSNNKTQCEPLLQQNHHSNNRPTSVYDNYSNNISHNDKNENRRSLEICSNNRRNRENVVPNPTQTHFLNTTVPQNIAAHNLGGKHTPTRNSLRHSRMIVLNRSGKIPEKYLPTLIRHRVLAKTLVTLMIISAIILCLVSLLLQLWAPNLHRKDNPYWSGVTSMISGVAAAIFLCFCPKEYPGRRFNWVFYAIKYISLATNVIAVFISLVIFILATMHAVSLATSTCLPGDNLNITCKCSANQNSTLLTPDDSYHYVDLNCIEVQYMLYILIISSSIFNAIICSLTLWYLVLHRKKNYTFTYSTVPQNEKNNSSSNNV